MSNSEYVTLVKVYEPGNKTHFFYWQGDTSSAEYRYILSPCRSPDDTGSVLFLIGVLQRNLWEEVNLNVDAVYRMIHSLKLYSMYIKNI